MSHSPSVGERGGQHPHGEFTEGPCLVALKCVHFTGSKHGERLLLAITEGGGEIR